MLSCLQEHPLLLLALLLLIGSLIGQIRIAGISIGSAATLFVALGITAWAGTVGVELSIPAVVGSFGLILFTYTVGVSSGPSFFSSLKRGWPIILGSVGCLVVVAAVALLAGWFLQLPQEAVAGTFAGALTNTPALAAASQASGGGELPAVGYSISYLLGVMGMLMAAVWALSRYTAKAPTATRLKQNTIHIDIDEPPTVGELVKTVRGIAVSRVTRAGQPVEVPTAERQLMRDDLISVVGEPEAVAEATKLLGHSSKIDIIGDRTFLDSNRITLSIDSFSGLPIRQLGLWEKFGAQVSRVRRGDVDMVVDGNFRVQTGDRLRVVAPRDKITQIRAYLGDSERGFSDINPTGFALGLTVGILVGLVPIPLPTGSFTLGSAAGTLIVGLIFGRLRRIGPLPVSMPSSASQTLSSIGMLTFLAYAGTKAGAQFIDAMTSDLGWKILLLGFIITTTAAIGLLLLGRLMKASPARMAGLLAGVQTQPAVLAFANNRTEFDTRVSLGYALVYPAAMVAKILLAQILVLL